ncbi:hypothetical protein HDU67_010437, partial [Dinochytrium kinnereticum]
MEDELSSPAPRRSQRTRKQRIPDVGSNQSGNQGPDEASPELDEMEADPESSDREESDVDFEEPKKPSPKKKTGRKAGKVNDGEDTPTTNRRTKKGKKTSGLETPHSDESLYAVVSTPGSALETAVVEWFESLERNKTEAMIDLINFLLQTIKVHDNYPIVARKTSEGKPSRFRSGFTDFWRRWYAKVVPTLYEEDEEDEYSPFEILKTWLITMSSSKFRPFRHTATAVSLVFMTCLCQTAATVHNQWMTASRQLNAQKKKGGVVRKEKEIEKDVEEIHSRKLKLEQNMNDFFDSAFMHRYRDTEPLIRSECIKELGEWIFIFPDTYLDSQYLRYIGWMLSDKTPQVRLEAAKALQKLYNSDTLVSGLRQFTDRHKTRMIEMALREVASNVRLVSISVIIRAAQVGLLEDEDRARILQLLFSDDVKIRHLVAPFVAEVWKEDVDEALKQAEGLIKTKSGKGAQGQSAAEKKKTLRWVELKSLSSMMLAVAKVIESKELQVQGMVREGVPPLTETAKATDSQTAFASSQMSMLFSQSQKPLADRESSDEEDKSDDEVDDISEEMLAAERRRRLLREEVINWIIEDHECIAGFTFLGELRISSALHALWDYIDVLKDVECMIEYLLQDFSESMADLGESQAGPSKSEMRLSREEESCLVFILHSSLTALFHPNLITSENARGSKKPLQNAKEIERVDEARVQAHRVFVNALPSLLGKYGVEYDGCGTQKLVILLRSFRGVELGVYEELGLNKVFETTVREVKGLFDKHSNKEVLIELANTFRHLLIRDVNTATLSTEKPGTSQKARKRIDQMNTDGESIDEED